MSEAEKPLVVFGEHDPKTLAQMCNCMSYGSAVEGVLCADGHLGYAQPVGGVIAYEEHVSVSGVGFDIGCGNMAVRTDLPYAAIAGRREAIMRDIARAVSFGIGRTNKERVKPRALRESRSGRMPGLQDLKGWRATSLARSGSGNHYIDLFEDEAGLVWIGRAFSARAGLGHSDASRFAKLAGGVRGHRCRPALVEQGS
jgi:tRNA-splicing ligase RtcB